MENLLNIAKTGSLRDAQNLMKAGGCNFAIYDEVLGGKSNPKMPILTFTYLLKSAEAELSKLGEDIECKPSASTPNLFLVIRGAEALKSQAR